MVNAIYQILRFERLLVGDLHIGNAFVKCDVKFPTAFKTIHTANSALLLVYDGVPVARSSSGLTTLIVE
jgi:hypothetical protein